MQNKEQWVIGQTAVMQRGQYYKDIKTNSYVASFYVSSSDKH